LRGRKVAEEMEEKRRRGEKRREKMKGNGAVYT